MLGVTHAATGATAWLAGCAALNATGTHPTLTTVAVGAVVCAAGGLLPDYDHPKSIASNCLPPITNIVAWLTRLVSRLVYRVTATDVDERTGNEGTHRALTHTAVFAVLVGVATVGGLTIAASRWPALAGWSWLGLPLGAGCLVHTLGDACTKSGVPLLWPLRIGGRRWRRLGAPLRFSTNSWFERVVLIAAVAAGFGAAWTLLPAEPLPVPAGVTTRPAATTHR